MRSSAFVPTVVLAALLALPAAAQPAKAAPAAAPETPLPDSLKDPQAQISYAIGLNIGAGLRRDAITVDPAIVAQGVKDATSGAKPLMTEDQMRMVLIQLQASVQASREAKAAHAAETNKAEGEAFLKANAAKPGVVTLPSGLQYQVITAGTGKKPTADDVVLCNYRGALLDGTEFDSSFKRGAPDTFPVSGVIKGWTEALQKMPVGSKWKIFVPSSLAYGEKGAGADIGPNAVLVFDIELLSIQPKE
jgi:FKBP-type peptidyl-prolyl cis-trans isomerase FklB